MHNGHPLTAMQASDLALRTNAMTVGFASLGSGSSLDIRYAIPAAASLFEGITHASWPQLQDAEFDAFLAWRGVGPVGERVNPYATPFDVTLPRGYASF